MQEHVMLRIGLFVGSRAAAWTKVASTLNIQSIVRTGGRSSRGHRGFKFLISFDF